MNDICDKCKKRTATHFITSSSASEPTISLCRYCQEEYDKFMEEAKEKFFGRKINQEQLSETTPHDVIKPIGMDIIQKGDKVKCLNCGKTITLDDETFIFDFEAEYICCPHCKAKIDVQYYHLHGKK